MGKLKRTYKGFLLTAFLILSAMNPISAKASSESDSKIVGFHQYTFLHGWALISFPFLPDNVLPTLDSVIGTQLTGSSDQDSADYVLTYNPANGEWISAFLNGEGLWEGELASDTLQRELAYWVHVADSSPDTQIVYIYGSGRDEENLVRGVFEPGEHLIGSYWSAPLEFNQSGLGNAGIVPVPGLIPSVVNSGFDKILGYEQDLGFYTIAWFDGTEWHGSVDSFAPGKGYVLSCHNQLEWLSYPRPDLPSATVGDIQPSGKHFQASGKKEKTSIVVPPQVPGSRISNSSSSETGLDNGAGLKRRMKK